MTEVMPGYIYLQSTFGLMMNTFKSQTSQVAAFYALLRDAQVSAWTVNQKVKSMVRTDSVI